MGEQIYNDKNPSSSVIQTTLREAADFLQKIDNTDKKWRGLTYSEVTNLLKSFLLAANPTLDLENASTEELIRQLNILLSEEENLQSVVPKNLQSLIAEAEEAQGKAKIFEQRAASDIKDYLERQKALLEKRNLQQPFREASSTLEETVVRKLSGGLPAGNKRAIAEAVVNEPQVDVSFRQALEKTANFSPQDQASAELKITERIHDTLQEAVPKALAKLRNQGIVVSKEEEETLLNLSPAPSDLALVAQQLYLPANKRLEMVSWLNDQLLPAMTPREAREIASVLVPVVAEKLPEIDQKTLTNLTAVQFIEVREQVEEAVVTSMAELAPELGEITPKRFARIISTFVPQNKEELANYTPILVIPKGNRIISIPTLKTEPIEVTSLPSRLPKIFASPLQRASEANPLHSTNEKGVRVVDEIKARLFKEGVSRGNALGFRNTVLRRWALNLTTSGITPEDIDFTTQRLISVGEKQDSPRIRELKEIRQALVQHQQTVPTVLLERLKKHGVSEGFKGNSFVQLPTQYNITIIRQAQFNPRLNLITRINSFLGRTFGRRILIFSSGQAVYVNKLNYAFHGLFENLKTGFFRTSFGKSISSGFNQLAQKGLQSLFGLAKFGLKTGASAGLKTVGLQALGILLPGIGNLAAAAIQFGSSLIKRLLKGSLSFFGSFLGGLTGQRKIPDNKDLSFLLPIFIGVFVGLFTLPFLSLLNIKNAMLPPPPIRYVGPFPPDAIKPTCLNLVDIFNDKAQAQCAPTALLMAISRMEAGGIWGMDCNQIAKFSTDKWWEQATPQEIDAGYCYDTCRRSGLCSGTTVMGCMQFEENTWKGYMPGYTTMDRCRIDLSIEAAAKKIKANSGTDSRNCTNWDEATVRDVAYHYCGSCGTQGCHSNPDPKDSCSNACGVDYCGGVWILYQQYASQ